MSRQYGVRLPESGTALLIGRVAEDDGTLRRARFYFRYRCQQRGLAFVHPESVAPSGKGPALAWCRHCLKEHRVISSP